jgi:signal transduction histidine kinase
MVNPLSNPFYLITPLVGAGLSFSLIFLVLRKDHRSLANRLFVFLLLSIGLQATFVFVMRASPDIEHAFYWERIAFPAGFALFIFYYHFTCVYTRRINSKLIWAAYSILVTICILSAAGLLVSHMTLESYGYAPHFYPTIYIISASGVPFLIMALMNLIQAFRGATRYEEKTRLTYMLIAIIVLFSFGILDLFPRIPPIGILGNVLFGLITAIAILKYHLFDIRIAMRKGLAYLLTSAAVASLYVGFLTLVNHMVGVTNVPIWAHVCLLILLALVFLPLWQRVQRLVDRWFYRQRYDFLKELERFSREAHDISDIKQLGSSLVRLLNQALQTSGIYLLLLSESGDFTLVAFAGKNTAQLTLRRSNPILLWLQSNRRLLYYQDLDIIPQLQSLTAKERNKLETIEVEVFIPLKTKKDELVGLLLLGKKLSQQLYSREDERLILTVADRVMIEVENARLYRDAVRARENLEAWLNSMSDCVIIVNRDQMVQFMNKAATQRFGGSAGRTCWSILGKDGQCSKCPARQHPGKHEDVSQYTISVGDREYDVVAAPLLSPDGGTSVIEVFRDTTERKRAQERERQLQEQLNLSSRLASVGELAAGVAHEINNPLTGILGFSHRLLRKCTAQNVRQDLERIYGEAMRAAKVMQNLLAFARHRQPVKQCSDINEIVQKTLELRSYELKTSNIEVVTHLALGLPKTMVDFHQIEEVFLNIILNAEQVMTETNHGGKLSINTELVKDYVRISFADNGPGIPTNQLHKVFDPFFTLRRERGGTGLGLSVSHGIVTSHGGRIYAKSRPGEGATFFVELPLTTENTDEGEVKRSSLPEQSK